MFTVSEFTQGVEDYERKIIDSGRIAMIREYEIERYKAESTVIEASQSKNKEVLAEIIKKEKGILNLISGEADIPSILECEALSILLTYMTKINRTCNLVCNELDTVFRQANLVSRGTAGGITIRLSYLQGKAERGHPNVRVICKTSNNFDISEDKSLIHEWFVAYTCLNALRRYIPSFPFVYSILHCSGVLFDANLKKVISTCGFLFKEGSMMLIQEDIHNSSTLIEFINENRGDLTIDFYLDALLQVFCALDMAFKLFDFTHYDLHTSNVLVQVLEEPIEINFFATTITSVYRVVIVDQAFSHVHYDLKNSSYGELFTTIPSSVRRNKNFGSLHNMRGGVLHNRSYPLFDIFRVFFDVYDLAPLNIKKQLLPLVKFFFKDMTVTKATSKGFISSTTFNNFSLPPFIPDLLQYTYEDFIGVIGDNYNQVLNRFVNPVFTTTSGTSSIYRNIIPTDRLSEILRQASSTPVLSMQTLFMLDKIGMLPKNFDKERLKRIWLSKEEVQFRHNIQLRCHMLINENVKKIKPLPLTSSVRTIKYKDIIRPIFFSTFVNNAAILRTIVNLLLAVDRSMLISDFANKYLQIDDPDEEEECCRITSKRFIEIVETTIDVTKEIILIIKGMINMAKRHANTIDRGEDSVEYFWYSVCSLITLQYAEVCLNREKWNCGQDR